MIRKSMLIGVAFLVIYFYADSFRETHGGEASFNPSSITQADILDLALESVGMEFFLPRKAESVNEKEFFEVKRSLMIQGNYPVFEEATEEEPVDCCFLTKVVYQISTPPENRDELLSCEGIINLLERSGYRINCVSGEVIEKETALSLFRDPQFLRDVMSTVNPVESSPNSSALSEAYSTPASPVR
jgi:hypothetical protein